MLYYRAFALFLPSISPNFGVLRAVLSLSFETCCFSYSWVVQTVKSVCRLRRFYIILSYKPRFFLRTSLGIWYRLEIVTMKVHAGSHLAWHGKAYEAYIWPSRLWRVSSIASQLTDLYKCGNASQSPSDKNAPTLFADYQIRLRSIISATLCILLPPLKSVMCFYLLYRRSRGLILSRDVFEWAFALESFWA